MGEPFIIQHQNDLGYSEGIFPMLTLLFLLLKTLRYFFYSSSMTICQCWEAKNHTNGLGSSWSLLMNAGIFPLSFHSRYSILDGLCGFSFRWLRSYYFGFLFWILHHHFSVIWPFFNLQNFYTLKDERKDFGFLVIFETRLIFFRKYPHLCLNLCNHIN